MIGAFDLVSDDILGIIFQNFETYNLVLKHVCRVCKKWRRFATGDPIKIFYVAKRHDEWWNFCNTRSNPITVLRPAQNEIDGLCKLSLLSPIGINLFDVGRRTGKTRFIADIINRLVVCRMSHITTVHCYCLDTRRAKHLFDMIRFSCRETKAINFTGNETWSSNETLTFGEITVRCKPSNVSLLQVDPPGIFTDKRQKPDLLILDEYYYMNQDFLRAVFSIKDLTIWGFGTPDVELSGDIDCIVKQKIVHHSINSEKEEKEMKRLSVIPIYTSYPPESGIGVKYERMKAVLERGGDASTIMDDMDDMNINEPQEDVCITSPEPVPLPTPTEIEFIPPWLSSLFLFLGRLP